MVLQLFGYQLKKRANGQATVEFALGAVLFILLTMAVMQFAILFHMKLILSHVSREGARYAAVHGVALNDTTLTNDIITKWAYSNGDINKPLLNPPLQAANITILRPEGTGTGKPIRLTIAYDIQPTLPLIAPLLPSTITFSADSSMRLE